MFKPKQTRPRFRSNHKSKKCEVGEEKELIYLYCEWFLKSTGGLKSKLWVWTAEIISRHGRLSLHACNILEFWVRG